MQVGAADDLVESGALAGAVLPDFDGACTVSLIPALFERQSRPCPDWVPESLAGAEQIVLFVVDGLGARQLEERVSNCVAMSSMEASLVTTVAPSTTAVALTSLATGLRPAEHGILGYRTRERGELLNVLRWQLGGRDARQLLPPEQYQPRLPFFGRPVPVVSRSNFAGSGFSELHLRGTPLAGWSVGSSIAVEVRRLLNAGEPFVYAYYDGLDRVAHESGLGEHYDAELVYVDHIVEELLEALSPNCALGVCADHGEVEVTVAPIDLAERTGLEFGAMSGEGRFRWLHGIDDLPGAIERLRDGLGDQAWVLGRQELIESGIFGGPLAPEYTARLGEIAVIARELVSFLDPSDPGDASLRGRHGSVTPDEMLVPLLGCRW